MYQNIITRLLPIVYDAGQDILRLYHQPTQDVQIKADGSPVTAADYASHERLSRELKKYYPDWPQLSEEGEHIKLSDRQNWETYWCFDPLDGTKGFVARTGEFAVSVALIHQGQPVVGAIYLPDKQQLFWGAQGLGAWQVEGALERPVDIQKAQSCLMRPLPAQPSIVLSRFSAAQEVYPDNWTTSICGGSEKFTLLAMGAADVYYRQAPCQEWDTAAGQCIVEAAGGQILTLTGQPLTYNQREHFEQPAFLATNAAHWSEVRRRLGD